MRSRATHTVDGARMRSHVATLATACLLNLTGTIQADLVPGQQNFADGKIARNDADLFYTIVGTSGDYVLVLSGGPGEDIRSMQGVADELGKSIDASCGNSAAPVDRSCQSMTHRRST